MVNLENLSDYDFELLVKDVMERRLGTGLRVFARGADGGVDMVDAASCKEIIVQTKHYCRSTPGQLLARLRNELAKVQKLRPKEYYIVTSLPLSLKLVKEIYELFREFMPDCTHVVTLAELDDFLQAEENLNIVRKHFKLWLTASGVLDLKLCGDIWLDSQDLLTKIKHHQALYVETKFLSQAYEILQKERAMLLVGAPGIGKTTTSEMLMAKFALQGYRVRYTTDVADLGELKKSLAVSPGVKEVILLDDCFGQCYFKMKETQENEILALVRHVQMMPNKILLMNSRVTIYNEARSRDEELARTVDNYGLAVRCLGFQELTDLEKAQILYNHLFFQEVSPEYWQELRNEERYFKIIEHENFTPRIIEFVTRKAIIDKVRPSEYYEYIIQRLNNPQQIWSNEFEKRLEKADRILLTTLYSLTKIDIPESILRKCYEVRLKNSGLDTSINHYENTKRRLSEAFITMVDTDNSPCVEVANPSVNDFLYEYLEANPLEREAMRAATITLEQVLQRYDGADGGIIYDSLYDDAVNEASELLKSGEILDFIYESESDSIKNITAMVAQCGVMDARYTEIVKAYLENPMSARFANRTIIPAARILEKLIVPELVEFYDLRTILRDEEVIKKLLDGLELRRLVELINVLLPSFAAGTARRKLIKVAAGVLEEAVVLFYMSPALELVTGGELTNLAVSALPEKYQEDAELVTKLVYAQLVKRTSEICKETLNTLDHEVLTAYEERAGDLDELLGNQCINMDYQEKLRRCKERWSEYWDELMVLAQSYTDEYFGANMDEDETAEEIQDLRKIWEMFGR